MSHTYSQGSGTTANPYIVNTLEDLNGIRFHLNSHFRLGKSLDFNRNSDYANVANKTTYTTGAGWDPITIFNGTFDGNGLSISNLYMNRPTVAYAGMFGQINSVGLIAIKKLAIVGASMITSAYSGIMFAGNHSHSSNSSFIVEDCVVINSSIVSAYSIIGGLGGWITVLGSGDFVAARRCMVINTYVEGHSGVGGMFGQLAGNSNSQSHRCWVQNCGTYGCTVKTLGLWNHPNAGNYTYCGGLVGLLWTSVLQNCFAANQLLPAYGGLYHVGGLSARGVFNAAVSNGYFDSTVSGISHNEPAANARTTSQMYQQSTYSGWDFTSTWSPTSTYPTLQTISIPVSFPVAHSKRLFFVKGGTTDIVRLYGSVDDVTSSHLALRESSAIVRASIVDETHPYASDIAVRHSGSNKRIASHSMPMNGLILYLDAARSHSYPGSGSTWTDLSGQGGHATLVNSPTYESTHKSLIFNGSTQHATISNNTPYRFSNVQPFTFNVWVRFTATSGSSAIISYAAGGDGRAYYLILDKNTSRANSFLFDYYDGSAFRGIQGFSNSITPNAWVMLTATSTGNNVTQMRFYQNGSAPAYDIRSAQSPASINYTGAVLQIAARDSSGRFQGNIGLVSVYNRVLPQDEIQALFNLTKHRFGL